MNALDAVVNILSAASICFIIIREVNTIHRKLDDFIESFDTPYSREDEEEDSNFPPLPKA